MALGRVSDLRKSSFLLSKGCAAFRGRGHRRHERHAEARPTCHLCSFSDSLLALHCQTSICTPASGVHSLPLLRPTVKVRCRGTPGWVE